MHYFIRISQVKVKFEDLTNFTKRSYKIKCLSLKFFISYSIPFKLHTRIDNTFKMCHANVRDPNLQGQCHTWRSYKLSSITHNVHTNYPISFNFHTIIELSGTVCQSHIADPHCKGQDHTWSSYKILCLSKNFVFFNYPISLNVHTRIVRMREKWRSHISNRRRIVHNFHWLNGAIFYINAYF